MGDICDGDDGETFFGLRSLPTAKPDDEAFDGRLGVSVIHSGECQLDFHTWDDDSLTGLVMMRGQEVLEYLQKELPWAATLAWFRYKDFCC